MPDGREPGHAEVPLHRRADPQCAEGGGSRGRGRRDHPEARDQPQHLLQLSPWTATRSFPSTSSSGRIPFASRYSAWKASASGSVDTTAAVTTGLLGLRGCGVTITSRDGADVRCDAARGQALGDERPLQDTRGTPWFTPCGWSIAGFGEHADARWSPVSSEVAPHSPAATRRPSPAWMPLRRSRLRY